LDPQVTTSQVVMLQFAPVYPGIQVQVFGAVQEPETQLVIDEQSGMLQLVPV
jgi:hypothetical protein